MHLFHCLGLKPFKVLFNMLFQLRIALVTIRPKHLSLLNLILEIPVKCLKVINQLQVHIPLQPRQVLELLNPQITMLCQLVLLLYVLWCLFQCHKLIYLDVVLCWGTFMSSLSITWSLCSSCFAFFFFMKEGNYLVVKIVIKSIDFWIFRFKNDE